MSYAHYLQKALRVKITKLRTSKVTRKLEIQTVTRGYV